jgi:hypothetical protein
MKNTTNLSRWRLGLLALGCAAGPLLPHPLAAEVSDADFNALKDLVQKLNEQVQSLRQTNQAVLQQHEQDAHQLQELQAKLAETQQTAAAAEQKSDAAVQAQSQPSLRAPLDEATVNRNFQILGDAEFQYVNADHQNGSYLLSDFAPIFLYRGGDNILFEAGFDTTLGNNAPAGGGYTTTFNLSFAQLDYVITDYLTLCAGELLLPMGTYSERGAGWLNKIPEDPLAVDALLPGSGVGAELRGALPLGDAGKLFNYSLFCVNGPSSADGTGNAGALDLGGNVGVRSDGISANLHNNPGGGGRLAVFLPFKPRYDLELGVSAMVSEWDNAGSHLWSAGVLDAALHLGPNFELKGEYIASRFGSDDLGTINQNGWFVQAGYKLAGLNLEFPGLNNLELVGRYDSLHDGLGNTTDRYSVGAVYYVTSALLLEGDYDFINSTDPTQPSNQLILQISYGF